MKNRLWSEFFFLFCLFASVFTDKSAADEEAYSQLSSGAAPEQVARDSHAHDDGDIMYGVNVSPVTSLNVEATPAPLSPEGFIAQRLNNEASSSLEMSTARPEDLNDTMRSSVTNETKTTTQSPKAAINDEGLLEAGELFSTSTSKSPGLNNNSDAEFVTSTAKSHRQEFTEAQSSNVTEDNGIVTSLGLDKDALVSPMPPRAETSDNSATSVVVEPTTPRATEKTTSTTTTTTTTVKTTLRPETKMVEETTTPAPKSSATTSAFKTETQNNLSSTLGTMLISQLKETVSAVNESMKDTLVTTVAPSSVKGTTTGFLSFLDPNFEKKYKPGASRSEASAVTSQATLDEASALGQPLQCYICTNASRPCDISGRVDPALIHKPEPVGVMLISCPTTSRSCGKLSVTVRYLYNAEVKYETTITRFCSSVIKEYCEAKDGSGSSYEQCYCRSHGCNSAVRLLNTSGQLPPVFLAAAILLSVVNHLNVAFL